MLYRHPKTTVLKTDATGMPFRGDIRILFRHIFQYSRTVKSVGKTSLWTGLGFHPKEKRFEGGGATYLTQKRVAGDGE
jgi:hypothetical protein